MKVMATYSIKGGVGKTSAAVNLAACAGWSGWSVLLWDLDPQGAATYLFRTKAKVKGGSRALVSRRLTLLDAAVATDVPNLDLVPADFRYRHLDLQLRKTKRATRLLADLVRPLSGSYDWVVLDCAPSISLVTEGVLEAIDILLVPVLPSTLSVRTVDQLLAFIDAAHADGAPSSRFEVVMFFSMVDNRRRLHREVLTELSNRRPGLVTTAAVPSASIVERMGVERAPIGAFASRTKAARAYAELWDELARRWPEP
ncbi:MAG TPA: ParA family protein [Acidimicrobiales bacterium]|nr:ParA family protein [Acidimicrobiales bacterium]